jgi:APA family basic amino acid/polyamine antiporter
VICNRSAQVELAVASNEREGDFMPGARAHRNKELGLWMSTSLVVGNMIGSGVFLLPAALGVYGGISIVGWLVTAAGAILLALVFAKLSHIMPKVGGPYAYTRRGFGDFAGFLVAWGYWISIWTSNAAISVAFVSYLTVFWPMLANNGVLAAAVAISAIWLLSWVNSAGIRNAGFVQLITTVLKLLPLVAISTLGFAFFNLEHFRPFNVSGESSVAAISATVALTLWAFLGLESATVPADDVKDPARTIPRATVLGTAIAALVYILSTVAVMGVIPPGELAHSNAPYADAAQEMWGSWAGYLVAAGAAVSCFGALNGWILMQGQIPFAAAKDGIFPRGFARLSVRGTPTTAILVSSVLVTVLIGMNYTRGLVEQFNFIILLAALNTLIAYVLTSMSELMIFITEREQFSGTRLVGSSVVAALAFLYSLWAIAGAGRDIVYLGLLLLVAGIPVYVWIVWRRNAASEDVTA